MPISFHLPRFRRRSLSWGLIFGLGSAALAFVVLVPLVAPQPAAAVSAVDSCFTRMECSQAMQNSELCRSAQGCCVGDRCFVPDSGNLCRKVGAEPVGFCYATSSKIQLSVNIGAKSSVVDLGDYINTVYRYAIGIASVLAAVMMMIGGFQYLTAADSDRVAKGKEHIIDALTGLVIILGAYLLLNTISPDLVSLQLPKIPIVKRQLFVGCSMTDMCFSCGQTYYVTNKFVADMQTHKTGVGANAPPNDASKPCFGDYVNVSGADIAAQCVGKSCTRLTIGQGGQQCSDYTRCRQPANSVEKPDCGEAQSVALAQKNAADAAAAAGPSATDSASGSSSTAQPTYDWFCKVCWPDGDTCSPNGPNDRCCGGFCGDGKCTAGQPGDKCGNDKDCQSGKCQTNWGNTCSSGETGQPCAAKSECKPGYFCKTAGMNMCTPGTAYSPCSDSSECQTGFCYKKTGAQILDAITSITLTSGICLPPGGSSVSCSGIITSSCEGGLKPVSVGGSCICMSGDEGSLCGKNKDCQSNYCSRMVCTTGNAGAPCDNNDDCQSGKCYDGVSPSVCVTGGAGSRCNGIGSDDCGACLRCGAGDRCVWTGDPNCYH